MWAPRGERLAYAVTLPGQSPGMRGDALYTQSLTGAPVHHLVARHAGVIVTAWWPNARGLLYGTDPQHSASLAADGLRLDTLALGTNGWEASSRRFATWRTRPAGACGSSRRAKRPGSRRASGRASTTRSGRATAAC